MIIAPHKNASGLFCYYDKAEWSSDVGTDGNVPSDVFSRLKGERKFSTANRYHYVAYPTFEEAVGAYVEAVSPRPTWTLVDRKVLSPGQKYRVSVDGPTYIRSHNVPFRGISENHALCFIPSRVYVLAETAKLRDVKPGTKVEYAGRTGTVITITGVPHLLYDDHTSDGWLSLDTEVVCLN